MVELAEDLLFVHRKIAVPSPSKQIFCQNRALRVGIEQQKSSLLEI